jgi:hypothetical protein
VPRLRRTGTVGLAFTAYDVWRRMSPTQRRMVVGFARRYGPLIAAQAARSARAAATKRKLP